MLVVVDYGCALELGGRAVGKCFPERAADASLVGSSQFVDTVESEQDCHRAWFAVMSHRNFHSRSRG